MCTFKVSAYNFRRSLFYSQGVLNGDTKMKWLVIKGTNDSRLMVGLPWVEVEGVPFKLWTNNTFTRIAEKWGKLLDVDDQDETCFHSKRLCVGSRISQFDFESMKMITPWMRKGEVKRNGIKDEHSDGEIVTESLFEECELVNNLCGCLWESKMEGVIAIEELIGTQGGKEVLGNSVFDYVFSEAVWKSGRGKWRLRKEYDDLVCMLLKRASLGLGINGRKWFQCCLNASQRVLSLLNGSPTSTSFKLVESGRLGLFHGIDVGRDRRLEEMGIYCFCHEEENWEWPFGLYSGMTVWCDGGKLRIDSLERMLSKKQHITVGQNLAHLVFIIRFVDIRGRAGIIKLRS
ncbi:hypothetical protein Tco_0870100 [Tanacetum coccineum]